MIYLHVPEVLLDTVGMACADHSLTPPRETVFGMTQVKQLIGEDLAERGSCTDYYGYEDRSRRFHQWAQPWASNLLKTLTYEGSAAPVLLAFVRCSQSYLVPSLQDFLSSNFGHAVAARLVITERIENLPVAPGAVFVGVSHAMGRSWEQRGGCHVPWESYTRDHPQAYDQWKRVKARILEVTSPRV